MFNTLSARLLVLTVLFVTLVDSVIVVSSVARFRRDWLDERLWDAQIASLAVATSMDGRGDPALHREALAISMIESVTYQRADGRVLTLGPPPDGPLGAYYDLRASSRLDLVQDSLSTLFDGSKGMVRVTGPARYGP